MSLNLKMVTFDLDYSQFLVDAENIDEAIDLAIEANKSDLLGHWDPMGIPESEMNARENYFIDDVVDMNFLGEIFGREDYRGNYNGTIVLRD